MVVVQNKFLFTYLSLLVQEGHFRMVEVFFLIVGHTHTSIDQYFSVIARIIWMCNFLGSPISLEYLLANGDFNVSMSGGKGGNEQGRALKSKPLLVRKLSVIYDMKTALKPLINKKLKYYPIPHQFRFEMYQGVCTMQYKMFSSQSDLLPLRPELNEGKLSACESLVVCEKLNVIHVLFYRLQFGNVIGCRNRYVCDGRWPTDFCRSVWRRHKYC